MSAVHQEIFCCSVCMSTSQTFFSICRGKRPEKTFLKMLDLSWQVSRQSMDVNEPAPLGHNFASPTHTRSLVYLCILCGQTENSSICALIFFFSFSCFFFFFFFAVRALACVSVSMFMFMSMSTLPFTSMSKRPSRSIHQSDTPLDHPLPLCPLSPFL